MTRRGWNGLWLGIMLPTLAGLAGCTGSPDLALVSASDRDSVAQRFDERHDEGTRTVIESAMQLSDKYAQLTAKAADMHESNQELTQENEQLMLQAADLRAKLKQAQSELTNSNELLMDLMGELSLWKQDILGFRHEMRKADNAQLEALLKILEGLGGEAELPEDQAALTMSLAKPPLLRR
ncbi:MAG: hypothetical protein IH892_12305 [Planctomycetes bacterium]|nr:hypothetical protein [Planctomycetota bacterium]